MSSFEWAFGKYLEHLKSCPVCGSKEGFWFFIRKNRKYAQCKNCGVELLLCVIYPMEEGRDKSVSLVSEVER
jgi:transcription elongation factor Elf1